MWIIHQYLELMQRSRLDGRSVMRLVDSYCVHMRHTVSLWVTLRHSYHAAFAMFFVTGHYVTLRFSASKGVWLFTVCHTLPCCITLRHKRFTVCHTIPRCITLWHKLFQHYTRSSHGLSWTRGEQRWWPLTPRHDKAWLGTQSLLKLRPHTGGVHNHS